MNIKFNKVSDFHRGILFELLKDAYSFDKKYEQNYSFNWRDFDNFFFDNVHIADKCCFVTTLNEEIIGFVSWDPRNIPEYVEIGHNCIISKYKGYGYGKIQLQQAIHKITQNNVKKIIVMTNDDLIPAQRNYESVGFKVYEKKKNQNVENIYYEYLIGDITHG